MQTAFMHLADEVCGEAIIAIDDIACIRRANLSRKTEIHLKSGSVIETETTVDDLKFGVLQAKADVFMQVGDQVNGVRCTVWKRVDLVKQF